MRSSVLALFAGLAFVAANATSDDLGIDELIARGYIVEERDASTESWSDVSFGVMLERSPVPGTSLTAPIEQRDLSAPREQELMVERDSFGGIKLPRNWEEGQTMAKRALGHVKKDGMAKFTKRFSAIITWYTGHDLLAPSCVQRSNWAPTDNSMVGALTINWGSNKPQCGAFIKIMNKGGSKSIIVRVVDSCAGCKSTTSHVDLTRRAFKTLYAIDVGKVYGLQAAVVKSPVKKWDKKTVALYGPQNL